MAAGQPKYREPSGSGEISPSLGRNVGKWFLGKADGPGTSFRPDCAGIRCLPSHPRFGARRSAASSQIDQRPPLSSLSVLPANQLRTGAFGRSILARSISARDQISSAPSVSAEPIEQQSGGRSIPRSRPLPRVGPLVGDPWRDRGRRSWAIGAKGLMPELRRELCS